jgi:hypothetical protein
VAAKCPAAKRWRRDGGGESVAARCPRPHQKPKEKIEEDDNRG